MARTALYAVQSVRNAGTALGAGATPDATNGNIVASPGPFHSGSSSSNADSSAHNLIIRASRVPGHGRRARRTPATSRTSTSRTREASVGDLTVTLAATSYTILASLEGNRFAQPDGSLWLDWSASTSMTVWIRQGPYL